MAFCTKLASDVSSLAVTLPFVMVSPSVNSEETVFTAYLVADITLETTIVAEELFPVNVSPTE